MASPDYKRFIEENYHITDKKGEIVPFVLNKIQNRFLTEDCTGRDIILKARQQGFSTLSLGIFTTDFMMRNNSTSVVVADNSDNATGLLDRVKLLIRTYDETNGYKTPMKYNSRYEMVNEVMNSSIVIGTAENSEFGRSKTITNLLFSEAAFYRNFPKLLAGALQAVVPDGRTIIETTANGFNEFKTFWDETKLGQTSFKPLFYKASDFYDQSFLDKKRSELGRYYTQEYPDTDAEAFLTSGDPFFDSFSLRDYLKEAQSVSTI